MDVKTALFEELSSRSVDWRILVKIGANFFRMFFFDFFVSLRSEPHCHPTTIKNNSEIPKISLAPLIELIAGVTTGANENAAINSTQ